MTAYYLTLIVVGTVVAAYVYLRHRKNGDAPR